MNKVVNPTKEVSLSSILVSSNTNVIQSHTNSTNPVVFPTNAFNFSNRYFEKSPVTFTTDVNFGNIIENVVPTIEKKIQKWVVKYNVSHNCVNDLLDILKSEGLHFT